MAQTKRFVAGGERTARIPSVPVALKLIGEAVKRGWAINNIDDDKFTILPPEEE